MIFETETRVTAATKSTAVRVLAQMGRLLWRNLISHGGEQPKACSLKPHDHCVQPEVQLCSAQLHNLLPFVAYRCCFTYGSKLPSPPLQMPLCQVPPFPVLTVPHVGPALLVRPYPLLHTHTIKHTRPSFVCFQISLSYKTIAWFPCLVAMGLSSSASSPDRLFLFFPFPSCAPRLNKCSLYKLSFGWL